MSAFALDTRSLDKHAAAVRWDRSQQPSVEPLPHGTLGQAEPLRSLRDGIALSLGSARAVPVGVHCHTP